MNRLFILLLILFISIVNIKAQKGAEVGAWVGSSFYFGDLNNLYRLTEPGLSGGLLFRYNVNSRLSPQCQINYSRLHANDANSSNLFDQNRNLSFYSDVFEITPAIAFNFIPYIHGNDDTNFSPYVVTGLSLFYHDPKTRRLGHIEHLQSNGTEGQIVGQEYSRISGGWLLGLGTKVKINYRWSINVDLSSRITWTDYLDDVSTVYPNFSTLRTTRGNNAVLLSDPSLNLGGDIPANRSGTQRGDGNDKDIFMSFGISLVYYFGGLECPQISRFNE